MRLVLPEFFKLNINNVLQSQLVPYFGEIKVGHKDAMDNPFIGVEEIDLSISWHALFKGKLKKDECDMTYLGHVTNRFITN